MTPGMEKNQSMLARLRAAGYEYQSAPKALSFGYMYENDNVHDVLHVSIECWYCLKDSSPGQEVHSQSIKGLHFLPVLLLYATGLGILVSNDQVRPGTVIGPSMECALQLCTPHAERRSL